VVWCGWIGLMRFGSGGCRWRVGWGRVREGKDGGIQGGSLCLRVKVALPYLYEYHSDELVPWRWMIPVV